MTLMHSDTYFALLRARTPEAEARSAAINAAARVLHRHIRIALRQSGDTLRTWLLGVIVILCGLTVVASGLLLWHIVLRLPR